MAFRVLSDFFNIQDARRTFRAAHNDAAIAAELLSESSVAISRDFFRATTGGDFGGHNRQLNIEQAVLVQHAAMRYIAMFRRAKLDAS